MQQAERNATVEIYEAVRAEIEAYYSSRMARITGSWGHWLGFNKMEDEKRDASEVRERVLRSETEDHERALCELKQRHTNYILPIWEGIRAARERIHLERLRALSRCYLVERTCDNAVTKCVPTPTGCHHPPSMCIKFDSGPLIISIVIPENITLRPGLDAYLAEVHDLEREKVRKASAELIRNYRYYDRADLGKYEYLQCRTKLALVDVEERFCAERLWEWRHTEEYRREHFVRVLGDDMWLREHFWTISFYPDEVFGPLTGQPAKADPEGEASKALLIKEGRGEGEIEEGGGRSERAVCIEDEPGEGIASYLERAEASERDDSGDASEEEDVWVERARGVARIVLND